MLPNPPSLTVRFAPSPTGRMHAGNIFSSLITWLLAKTSEGNVVLRIEDLDKQRSKPQFASQIMHDYEMLGLTWDKGPFYQHDRDGAYQEAFDKLSRLNLVYPCFCSRADLHAQSAPHAGETYVYAQTCRHLSDKARHEKLNRFAQQGRHPSYRLMTTHEDIEINDLIQGNYSENLADDCGDFVIRRTDGTFAYHLAVVVDDYAQGINLVSRGVDLLSSTPQQIYLQRLLGLSTPYYAHIPLIVDKSGRRLSKRNQDASLECLLDTYQSAAGVIGTLAAYAGFIESPEPLMPQDLAKYLTFEDVLNTLKNSRELIWEP